MKRWARIGALFLPTAAQAPGAAGLQRVARGRDGVVAAGVICQWVRQARLCFPGTKPTCPSGGC